MSKDDRFLVTVNRANNGEHDDPHLTLSARRLALDVDGSLSIWGEDGLLSVSPGLWNGFEVKLRSSDAES